MKPPVALFKKKILKLYFFLKVKQKLINTVACFLYKRKDVKKNVKKKIGERFSELICFIFYMSLKNNTSLRLCFCIFCSPFFYLCFVRSSHWEMFVQIDQNPWKILVKVFIGIKVAGCRPLALLKLTLSHTYVIRTLQKLLPCVLGNV